MNSGFDRNTVTTITPCIQICQSECFLWYNLLILLPESAGWFMGAACGVQWPAYYPNMLDSLDLNTLTRLEPPRWSCHWVQSVGFVHSRDSGRFHEDSLTVFNESCSTSLKFPLFVSPNSEVLCVLLLMKCLTKHSWQHTLRSLAWFLDDLQLVELCQVIFVKWRKEQNKGVMFTDTLE